MTLAATDAQAAEVLVVLSDADHLDLKDGKVFPTGFYLNELMQPVKLLLDAGHHSGPCPLLAAGCHAIQSGHLLYMKRLGFRCHH